MCVRETERDRVEEPGKVWKGVFGSAEKQMEILEFGKKNRIDGDVESETGRENA